MNLHHVRVNPHDRLTGITKETGMDMLTGLHNRTQFEQRLSFILEQSWLTDSQYVFCYIDLDLFKVVNDIYSHTVGDQLICSVSELIRQSIREHDFMARLGGDLFGLILKVSSLQEAEMIAERICASIRQHRSRCGDDEFGISASIGIVPVHASTDSIGELMKRADVACYTAKNRGGDRVQIYISEDRHISQHHDGMHWYNRIVSAIDNDRLMLFAQPIAPLNASAVREHFASCEILVRMLDESGELVMPGKFMPVAAHYKLSSRIDKWIIGHVLDYLDTHPQTASSVDLMTINLSGQSLSDSKLLDWLCERLQQVSFNPALLCFEITETEAIAGLATGIDFINTIKNRFGCLFALDDFGAGYASFKYIRELPIDMVKIDGTFIRDMQIDPISRILINSLNEIAQLSNKRTVAEWVEERPVLDELQEIGVDYAQGHYLGSPMPFSDYIRDFEVRAHH